MAADVLITQMVLDDSRYVAGSRRVVSATKSIADAQRRGKGVSGSFQSDMDKMVQLGGVATGIAQKFVTALAAVGGFFGGISAYSLKAFGDIEALQKALDATTGSAEEGKKRFEELRQLAKAPGLGFEEAIRGFVQLKGAGASSEFGERLIKEFANANAFVGGDRETFSRIMFAVSQIMNKRTLEGQDARQLAEANLPIYRILKDKFGTADTAELAEKGVTSAQALNAIVEELSKFKRVSGGFRNELENLADISNQAAAAMGGGILGALSVGLGDISAEVERFNEAGVFKDFGEMLGGIVESFAGGASVEDAMYSLVYSGTFAAATLQNFGNNLTDIGKMIKFLWDWSPLGLITRGVGAIAGAVAGATDDPTHLYSPEALAEGAMNMMRMRLGTQKIKNAKARAEQAGVNGAIAPGSTAPKTKAEEHLEKIERHTSKIADSFDQSSFGGGDVIRQGISIQRIQGFNRGSGRPTSSELGAAARMLRIFAAQMGS